MKTVVLIVIGAVSFGFGLFIAVLFILNWLKDRKSRSWPSVKGTITHSDVICEEAGFDDNGQPVQVYHPEIIYIYKVHGQQYGTSDPVYSDIVQLGPASELTKKYPVGMEVLVYYNPEKPLESTLRTGYKGHYIWGAIFVAVSFACSGLFFSYAFGLIR